MLAATVGFSRSATPGKLVTLRRVLIMVALLAVSMTMVGMLVSFERLAAEDGILETVQLALLLGGAAAGLTMCWSRRAARDRWNVFWLGAVCTLMAWREMDGHIWLNSEKLGGWALHYRMTWLTDGAVAWYVKGFWILMAAAGATVLMLPLVMARPNGFVQLKRRDLGAWLFLAGVAALVLGYASDDLLGRDQFVHYHISQLFEEGFELFAALAFVLTTILSIETPLDVREGAERRVS